MKFQFLHETQTSATRADESTMPTTTTMAWQWEQSYTREKWKILLHCSGCLSCRSRLGSKHNPEYTTEWIKSDQVNFLWVVAICIKWKYSQFQSILLSRVALWRNSEKHFSGRLFCGVFVLAQKPKTKSGKPEKFTILSGLSHRNSYNREREFLVTCTQKVNLISTQFTFFNGFSQSQQTKVFQTEPNKEKWKSRKFHYLSQYPAFSIFIHTVILFPHTTNWNMKRGNPSSWNHLRFIYSDLFSHVSCVCTKSWCVRRVEFIYFCKFENFACIETYTEFIVWVVYGFAASSFLPTPLTPHQAGPHTSSTIYFIGNEWEFSVLDLSAQLLGFCIDTVRNCIEVQ